MDQIDRMSRMETGDDRIAGKKGTRAAGRDAPRDPYLPWLDEIRPYVPGKPPESVLRKIKLAELAKLASNENPLGPSARALEAIQDGLRDLNRYPDDQSQELKETISRHFDVPVEQIAVGNGSNDLIELLVRITTSPGREVVMAESSFPTCRIAALGAGAMLHLVPLVDDRHDLAAMARAVTPNTFLVYVCNPNNPTGTMNTRDEVDTFLDALPDHVIAVFDEAYFEYVDDDRYPDLLPRILRQENVVVLRTFSKCYSLAALRVGYGFCPTQVVRHLEKVRLPFNVNGLAHRAAIASLEDPEQVPQSRAFNAEGKGFLRRELDRLGLFYRDSVTNFLMARIPWDGDLYTELLSRGVVIRPLDSFGLPPHHYRITVGTQAENERFVRELESILRSDG